MDRLSVGTGFLWEPALIGHVGTSLFYGTGSGIGFVWGPALLRPPEDHDSSSA